MTQARPAVRHPNVTAGLIGELRGPFQRGRAGPGGWLILNEPELHLDPHILVPDVAAWRREGMPDISDAVHVDFRPDWVCEVLSPPTHGIDRADKLPIYAARGVLHAWLIEPVSRTLETYRLEGGRWLLLSTHRDDAVVRIEPFEAIELELSALWTRPL